jgi:hypothetical protein
MHTSSGSEFKCLEQPVTTLYVRIHAQFWSRPSPLMSICWCVRTDHPNLSRETYILVRLTVFARVAHRHSILKRVWVTSSFIRCFELIKGSTLQPLSAVYWHHLQDVLLSFLMIVLVMHCWCFIWVGQSTLEAWKSKYYSVINCWCLYD